MPLPKPAEFTEGAPLERLDAERQRRRTSAQAMGYGGVAAGSGLASAGLANLKVAGTDVGQAGLSAAQAKTRRKSPEAAQQIGRLRDAGKWARANRGKTLAGTVGLAGLSGVSGIAGRHKQNEEQGMSQEIGRLRAGERYAATRRSVKKDIGLRTMLLATDYDLASPRTRKAIAFADRNKKKIAGGASAATAATAGGAVANERIQRSRQRRQLERMAKAERRRPDATTAGLIGVGAAGTSTGAGAKKIVRGVNQRHLRGIDSQISTVESAYGLSRTGKPVARRAVPQQKPDKAAQKAKMATMTPEQKQAYIASMQNKARQNKNSTAGVEDRLAQQRKKLRLEDLGAQRAVPRLGRRAVTGLHAGGYGIGGAALLAAAHRGADKDVTKYESRDVNAAAASGVGGVALYQGVPYAGNKRRMKRNNAQIRGNPGLNARVKQHRKDSGLSGAAGVDDPAWTKYHRTYPKDLPGSRLTRLYARTHNGKTGMAITGGVGLTAGTAGVKADRNRRKDGVSKGYYAREERVSPLRAGQYVAGAGIAAAGLSRSGMVGRALAHGVRQAELGGNKQAVTALQRAMAMRGQIRAGTAPSIAQMRKIKQIDNAINAVPRGMRAEVAAAAGLLMASNARPVRQTSYRPVGRY